MSSVYEEHPSAKCRQYVNQIIVTDHNETNSLSFKELNLCHIWGDMMHYRPPTHIFFGGTYPPVPRGIYATGQINKRIVYNKTFALLFAVNDV